MDAPSKEKAREKVKYKQPSWKNKGVYIVDVRYNMRTITLIVLYLMQAMAIKEHIGYPDHILQESNQKLDQEYAHVSK